MNIVFFRLVEIQIYLSISLVKLFIYPAPFVVVVIVNDGRPNNVRTVEWKQKQIMQNSNERIYFPLPLHRHSLVSHIQSITGRLLAIPVRLGEQ